MVKCISVRFEEKNLNSTGILVYYLQYKELNIVYTTDSIH